MQKLSETQRFDRLPMWAQEGIRTLEAQNSHLLKQIDGQVTGDHPETNAHVQAKFDGEFLPSKHHSVRFKDGDAFIDVRWDATFKRLRVATAGFEYLAVLPHSSNVVHIVTRKD